MQTAQIIRQTNQTPFARDRQQAAQREMTEAQHFLDLTEHRFNRAFTTTINRFARRRCQFVRHLLTRTGTLGRRLACLRKMRLPPPVVRRASGSDLRVNPGIRQNLEVRFAEIPGVEGGGGRPAKRQGNGLERGSHFSLVVGVVGERTAYHQHRVLV